MGLYRPAARRRDDRFFQGKEQGVAHHIGGVRGDFGFGRLPGVFQPAFARNLVNVIMALLLVVFAVRLAKTKNSCPAA